MNPREEYDLSQFHRVDWTIRADWIKQTDAERAKYPNTMSAFRRANGLF